MTEREQQLENSASTGAQAAARCTLGRRQGSTAWVQSWDVTACLQLVIKDQNSGSARDETPAGGLRLPTSPDGTPGTTPPLHPASRPRHRTSASRLCRRHLPQDWDQPWCLRASRQRDLKDRKTQDHGDQARPQPDAGGRPLLIQPWQGEEWLRAAGTHGVVPGWTLAWGKRWPPSWRPVLA